MNFIKACFKKQTPYTPIWMMRQAGRYLPEYMKVRQKAGDFLSLCKSPQLAAEVTIQPVDIIGVDAAILFSDILVVPLEMGMNLSFVKNEGPVFSKPIENEKDIENLSDSSADNLSYVYETIEITRKNLSSDKALIGFTGSPWTLSTYMIEGQGTKTYAKCKKLIYSNPQFMHKLLQKVTKAVIEYAKNQIKSGINAIQIFDSWGSALEESAFFEFSWNYMKQIASEIKKEYPHIPVILFSKGICGYLEKIDGDFDVFGVGWETPMQKAKDVLFDRYALQGNLEPCRLYSKEAIKSGVKEILKVMNNEPGHIFNLGHGMLPDLDVENAKYLVELVHELSKR